MDAKRRTIFGVLITAGVVVALAIPAIVYAWSQYYARNTVFSPDGIALSGFNNGLNYNHVSWVPQQGPAIVMQSTLCDASYQCYPYTSSNAGVINDPRSISYGRGKCHEKADQIYQAFVYECVVDNEH